MQPILTPDMQEATESLIENLLASAAFIRYQQAQTRLVADREANALLQQLGQVQANLRQKQVNGGITQTDIDALRSLQEKARANQIIMDYIQAQQQAADFLRQINGEIGQWLGMDFAALAKQTTC